MISYVAYSIDPHRLAAGYVDRILKGEKPADLPVQAPTKYELELHGGRRQLALSLQGVRICMRLFVLLMFLDARRRSSLSITLRACLETADTVSEIKLG